MSSYRDMVDVNDPVVRELFPAGDKPAVIIADDKSPDEVYEILNAEFAELTLG